MDRQIVYPGAIPLETDLLNTNKNAMIGLSKLAAAILGTSTFLNGLACTPTGPASLQVYVAPGEIYSLQNVDGTAYSSIAADTTHAILKQGISLDQLTMSCPAPVTAGQSVNYLIQVAYQDTDSGAVVLPYYNSSNPSQAYAGPANSGTAQNTVRKGVCAVSAKAGVAATTGTQTTPAPDAGYIGAFVVTVAYGQTQITAPNIAAYAGAPFLPSGGLVVGGLQGNACNVSAAGGTADAITGIYTPGITALTNGMTLYIRAASTNVTTTPTFTPNSGSIAAKQIVKRNGQVLLPGDIAGGAHWIELQYDLTLDKWVLLNPASGAGNMQSVIGMGANLTLTQAQAGSLVEATGAGGYTLTMCSTTSVAGVAFAIYNNCAAAITVAAAGGQNINVGTSNVASFSLPSGGTAWMITDGVSWEVIAGTVMGIGGNQTWQSVIGSRALATTYTNTTGRPILVFPSAYHASTASGSIQFTINGLTCTASSASAVNTIIGTCFIVPPGATYSVTWSVAGAALSSWFELK